MYCYFCHGYSGDAKTVASSYLQPPPRDFTVTALDALDEQYMVDVVSRGKPGTAMMSFSAQLNAQQIADVVYFVRRAFMAGEDGNTRYHIIENGWDDHQRYAPAFPFVSGELAIDTPQEQLNDQQRYGLQLFLQTCITCHEGRSEHDDGTLFDTRAVSYPRAGYSHRAVSQDTGASGDGRNTDGVSSASPYGRHDIAPDLQGLNGQERTGEKLFQQNCAFCHGADGTGKNWIGSFLEARPRNLSDAGFIGRLSDDMLKQRIRDGLPGTTMPAWKHVLNEEQIEAIVS